MSEPERSNGMRRRTRLTLGLVGGLGVLGAGAALSAGLAGHHGRHESMATPPSVAVSSAQPSSEGASAPPEGAQSAVSQPPVSQPPVTDAERIASARAGAKHSVPIQHPLIDVVPTTPSSDLQIQDVGSIAKGQTLRVVSAPTDLSGQNELGWVADHGQAVGSARCSQTFRFANQAKAARKETLLVCWRVSATKSVYTVLVNLKGKPSRAQSVAAITKQWAKLS
jgi:hypothetical protein